MQKIDNFSGNKDYNENYKPCPTAETDEYNLDDIELDIYPANKRISEPVCKYEEAKEPSYFNEKPKRQTMNDLNNYRQNQCLTTYETQPEVNFDNLFYNEGPSRFNRESPDYYATYNKPISNDSFAFDDIKSTYTEKPFW